MITVLRDLVIGLVVVGVILVVLNWLLFGRRKKPAVVA